MRAGWRNARPETINGRRSTPGIFREYSRLRFAHFERKFRALPQIGQKGSTSTPGESQNRSFHNNFVVLPSVAWKSVLRFVIRSICEAKSLIHKKYNNLRNSRNSEKMREPQVPVLISGLSAKMPYQIVQATRFGEVSCIGTLYCRESLHPIICPCMVSHLLQKVPCFFTRRFSTIIPEIRL